MRLFLLLSVILIASSACKQEAPQSGPQPTPITSTFASTLDLPTYLYLPGTTASVLDVKVQARVEGWLLQRHFQEGQLVNEGDLLFEIDSAPFDAQLLQAEAALASAKAQVSYAQKEFDRNEPLVHTGAVSKQSFDALVTQLEQSAAQLAQAEAGVALASLNVSYCVIHAPISGKIGMSSVDVGSLVGPGVQTTLAEIVQVSPMFVEFHPPASRLQTIQTLMKKGPLPIHISIKEDNSEGQASVDTSVITTNKVTGSLVFLNNTIQASTSTFLARGEFINELGVLPGQYAEVQVQLRVIEDAVMVPAKTVMQQPGSYYVWTISEKDTAVITPVTVGASYGSQQHILSGLKAGDEVIVDGTINLRSGMSVLRTSKEKEE